MSLFAVGRVCLKIAGRDAGQKCVVVERLDNTFVLIDGATRRRKANIKHLEPLAETLDISSGAHHTQVVAAFKKLNLVIVEKKSKQAPARAVKQKANKKNAATTSSEAQKEKKTSAKKLKKKAADSE